jgi:hypothetical protein
LFGFSNFLRWAGDDDDAVAVGWQNDAVIHSMNKSFASITDVEYARRLQTRTNAIVIGDTLGDAMMGDGAPLAHQLRVGFLDEFDTDESLSRAAARLEDYKRSFNVVLVSGCDAREVFVVLVKEERIRSVMIRSTTSTIVFFRDYISAIGCVDDDNATVTEQFSIHHFSFLLWSAQLFFKNTRSCSQSHRTRITHACARAARHTKVI